MKPSIGVFARRSRRQTWLLLRLMVTFITLLLLPSVSEAEIATGVSLDWMVVDSDLVVRGSVVRFCEASREMELASVVPLVGSLREDRLVVILHNCPTQSITLGEEVVLFLRSDPALGWVPYTSETGTTDCMVSLNQPQRAYTARGDVLMNGSLVWSHLQQVTGRVLARQRRPAPGVRLRYRQLLFDVTMTPAGQQLFSGSAVFLVVPPYESYRADILASTHSDFWHERQRAAEQLASYPGAETERRLRELLADEDESKGINQEGQVLYRRWPVRVAAWRSLLALGIEAEPPVFEEDGSTTGAFEVFIEQEGSRLPIIGNRVQLRPSPFTITIHFVGTRALLVNASLGSTSYDAALAGLPVSEILGFVGTGMADQLGNPEQTIIVADDSPNYWFIQSQDVHRFDSCAATEDGVLCRRRVAMLHLPEGNVSLSISSLFLVFLAEEGSRLEDTNVELQRRALMLEFAEEE